MAAGPRFALDASGRLVGSRTNVSQSALSAPARLSHPARGHTLVPMSGYASEGVHACDPPRSADSDSPEQSGPPSSPGSTPERRHRIINGPHRVHCRIAGGFRNGLGMLLISGGSIPLPQAGRAPVGRSQYEPAGGMKHPRFRSARRDRTFSRMRRRFWHSARWRGRAVRRGRSWTLPQQRRAAALLQNSPFAPEAPSRRNE